MEHIRFELKKITGAGILLFGLFITILSVVFQGYLGLLVDDITADIIYVTAMDLFASFFFPIIISVVVARSFFIEEVNCGIVNSFFFDISVKKSYKMKLLTNYIINAFYFFLATAITLVFVGIKGGNPFFVLLNEWEWVVLSMLNVFTLVNFVAILIMVTRSQMISMLISVVATVFGSVLNPLGFSWINPWYNFEHALFYRGLKPVSIVYMVVVFVIGEFMVRKIITRMPMKMEGMI